MNSRGPKRADSAPNRPANASIITVIGRSAVPATKGLNPDTVCRATTSSSNAPPIAP